jgi:hypothetical protein
MREAKGNFMCGNNTTLLNKGLANIEKIRYLPNYLCNFCQCGIRMNNLCVVTSSINKLCIRII